jgi:ferritin-like metal-binding protein YciE
MHFLASLFVSLVAIANTLMPAANLPKVLGVETENTATPSATLKRPELRTNFLKEREELKTELKTRLQTIKDEKKKQTVENLNEKLSMRQDNWVDSWKKTIVRMKEISVKIKALGGNTKEVDAAIAAAESAVDNFAAKNYTFSFSDEKNLGQGVRTAVQNVKTDAKVVQDALKAAKEALLRVARETKGTKPSATP